MTETDQLVPSDKPGTSDQQPTCSNRSLHHEIEVMPIPRFWASAVNPAVKPNDSGYLLWRSSPYSVEAAQEEVNRVAMGVAEKLKSPQTLRGFFSRINSLPQDGYSVHREKLLEEYKDEQGRTYAFLTRNTMGARVLNCRNLMIFDWDIEPDLPSGCLASFFYFLKYVFCRGFSQKEAARIKQERADRQTMIQKNPWLNIPFCQNMTHGGLGRLHQIMACRPPLYRYLNQWSLVENARPIDMLSRLLDYIATHPQWSVQIYQTAGGWRGIVTHAPFDPLDESALTLMKQFRCDPRYILFCRRQCCFRARVSPKGFRCGFQYSKIEWEFRFRYPWLPDDKESEEKYEKGVQQYEEKAAPYSVCRYLGTLGSGIIAPELLPLIKLHDEMTCTEGPLA